MMHSEGIAHSCQAPIPGPRTKERDPQPILEVRDLKKFFSIRSKILKRRIGWVRAVDGVSFAIQKGEIFGIVGESGCGKSTLGKSILGIYKPNEGSVVFRGGTISNLPLKQALELRKDLQYVYQDAGASLDPMWIIRRTLREPLAIHTTLSGAEIEERIIDVLAATGLNPDHLTRYPHEFSGGQQRRLGLARILTLNPSLIIFDEPTSGLDVSVQATILKLFLRLAEEFALTYILISHNLAVIRMMCDRVAVMYLGRFVEIGKTRTLFENPLHPYTRFLLAAIPEPGRRKQEVILTGEPPSPDLIPSGCRFWPRCPRMMDICTREDPPLLDASEHQRVACHITS